MKIGKNTRLRETWILGSLRWWYEALIRGLGGTACDPTDTKCNRENHCDACKLFGCTGRARKFGLEVESSNKNEILFRFVELRKIENVEWGLLNKTLGIISQQGAIGGKLAEPEYGLIEVIDNGIDINEFTLQKEELSKYFKEKGEKWAIQICKDLSSLKII